MVGDKDPEQSTSAALTTFSATDAALGYFFQVRIALLLALRRLSTEQSFAVYIETIDDVVFEPDGQAPELLQVKHHQRKAGNLTDASTDLWKTMRVWIEGRSSAVIPSDAQLFLVTTADVGQGSIASKLQATDRDETAAVARLLATASTSVSTENALAYSLFRALTAPEREALVSSVTILPRTPNIVDVDADLRKEVWSAARPEHRSAFLVRLEGWWYDRAVRHLRDDKVRPILSEELQSRIDELRSQFFEDALPVDDDIFSQEIDPSIYWDNAFVRQLELTGIGQKRIIRAVRDYYRAFEQRSRWVREELVHVGELGRYERRLREEWQSLFDRMEDDLGSDAAENARQKAAQQLYAWVEDACFPIRPKVQERSLTQGSFHMLADDMKVGWHPQFRERLKSLLEPEAAA